MADNSLEQFGYEQQLKRSLDVWQLTAFGLNYMIPLSPAIFFGFVLSQSGGSVALPFIIGGIAIFFTTLSYAIMVQHFPLAGSLYNFISLVWNKRFGFLAGWALLLDYLFITTVTSMSASLYIIQLIHVPYTLVLFIFVSITGLINLFGIRLLARLGLILLLIAEIIVIASFLVWSHAIVSHASLSALFSLEPFHFTNISMLMNATSLAVASYLGFDAISTLAEEAKDPKRGIPKAMFLCVFIGGLGMVLTGYLGVLASPNWPVLIKDPNWQATALFYVSKATGGPHFAYFYSLGFILSMAVFNMVGTASTARILFGMGRDNMINKRIFASVNKRWHTPHWNILLITGLSFVVGSLAHVTTIANLVNYGALLGFAVLNISVIALYFKKKSSLIFQTRTKQFFYYLLFPMLGFLIVAWVFYSLDTKTHTFGSMWLLAGIIYLIVHQTRSVRIR